MKEGVSYTKCIVILAGPTASGKTALALEWAERLGAEIVSADSMQVYRYMDVGTAKPSRMVRERVPHHLLDVVDPDGTFNAVMFQQQADAAIADIHGRGKRALIVGGTGLYIRALHRGLFEGPDADTSLRDSLRREAQQRGGVEALYEDLRQLDPKAARKIHPKDLFRIVRALEVYYRTGIPISAHQLKHNFAQERYRAIYVGINVDRSELYERIDKRVDYMMANGLLEEVAWLIRSGYGLELHSMRAIGYRHVGKYLMGKISLSDAVEQMKRDTHHYAKRQLTWFRGLRDVHWFDPTEASRALEKVKIFLDKFDNP